MLGCNIECMRYATRKSILYRIEQNVYFSSSFFSWYFVYVSFAGERNQIYISGIQIFFDTNEMIWNDSNGKHFYKSRFI